MSEGSVEGNVVDNVEGTVLVVLGIVDRSNSRIALVIFICTCGVSSGSGSEEPWTDNASRVAILLSMASEMLSPDISDVLCTSAVAVVVVAVVAEAVSVPVAAVAVVGAGVVEVVDNKSVVEVVTEVLAQSTLGSLTIADADIEEDEDADEQGVIVL